MSLSCFSIFFKAVSNFFSASAKAFSCFFLFFWQKENRNHKGVIFAFFSSVIAELWRGKFLSVSLQAPHLPRLQVSQQFSSLSPAACSCSSVLCSLCWLLSVFLANLLFLHQAPCSENSKVGSLFCFPIRCVKSTKLQTEHTADKETKSVNSLKKKTTRQYRRWPAYSFVSLSRSQHYFHVSHLEEEFIEWLLNVLHSFKRLCQSK